MRCVRNPVRIRAGRAPDRLPRRARRSGSRGRARPPRASRRERPSAPRGTRRRRGARRCATSNTAVDLPRVGHEDRRHREQPHERREGEPGRDRDEVVELGDDLDRGRARARSPRAPRAARRRGGRRRCSGSSLPPGERDLALVRRHRLGPLGEDEAGLAVCLEDRHSTAAGRVCSERAEARPRGDRAASAHAARTSASVIGRELGGERRPTARGSPARNDEGRGMRCAPPRPSSSRSSRNVLVATSWRSWPARRGWSG